MRLIIFHFFEYKQSNTSGVQIPYLQTVWKFTNPFKRKWDFFHLQQNQELLFNLRFQGGQKLYVDEAHFGVRITLTFLAEGIWLKNVRVVNFRFQVSISFTNLTSVALGSYLGIFLDISFMVRLIGFLKEYH